MSIYTSTKGDGILHRDEDLLSSYETAGSDRDGETNRTKNKQQGTIRWSPRTKKNKNGYTRAAAQVKSERYSKPRTPNQTLPQQRTKRPIQILDVPDSPPGNRSRSKPAIETYHRDKHSNRKPFPVDMARDILPDSWQTKPNPSYTACGHRRTTFTWVWIKI